MVPPKKSTAEATISTPAAELTLRWLSAKTSSASARMDRINLDQLLARRREFRHAIFSFRAYRTVSLVR